MEPSKVYKPTVHPQLSRLSLFPTVVADRQPPRHRTKAIRTLTAVASFIKLLESLFWLSLLLEATHNDEDNSDVRLTMILAIAFIVALTTGFVGLFGPCFQGVVHLQTMLLMTVASFVWSVILLVFAFTLSYYKFPGNEDNQMESAFNATIGLITSGALFVMLSKLIHEAKKKRTGVWLTKQTNKPLI